MNTLHKYSRIWWMMTVVTTQTAFATRFGAVIFILGKIIRFSVVLFFLIIIVNKTKTLAGYSFWQVIFFYATYNLIDTLPQFFLREVYRFRGMVVQGDFDMVLVKPFSPLFKALLGGSDALDLSILLIAIGVIFFCLPHLGHISSMNIVLYIILIVNSFIIALAFHILALAIGILSTEVDNAIGMYRDITQMGRYPIGIYTQPLRGILTFVIPVGIMMSFPSQALLGTLSWQFVLLSFWIAGFLLFGSYEFWKYSLTKYASASS